MNKRELAEAMRVGVQTPGVEESIIHYLDSVQFPGFCKACALGAALIGKFGGDYRKAENAYDDLNLDWCDAVRTLAHLLDISEELAEKVEGWHLGDKPVAEIAAQLEQEESCRRD